MNPSGVFVYGTLMPGGRNAPLASAVSTPLVQAATLPGFALYGLGRYPGVVPESQGHEFQGHESQGHESQNVVRGALYTYPPGDMARVLAALDTLEGYRGPAHPENLFDRRTCGVTLASGETRPAWTYVYARPLPPLARPLSGEWSTDHE